MTPQAICFGWNDCLQPGESFRNERLTPSVLIEYARYQTEVYTNDTVAVMSGCDLCFTDANDRFLRQDGVLAMANRMSAAQRKRRRVHVVHSTPACYVEALHSASREWPRFEGDLLPYTDRPGRTWTGFYTTRPNLKMMVRYANGFLQAREQSMNFQCYPFQISCFTAEVMIITISYMRSYDSYDSYAQQRNWLQFNPGLTHLPKAKRPSLFAVTFIH
ncbi:lysosomal alpha-mannosidase-like [Dermacentor variabilis]|uniref:lysosomal alpha-mannosidase-like n=1 Tax=Dermacentor variabilis TaxID=34621 RepID=UPI003F5BA40F